MPIGRGAAGFVFTVLFLFISMSILAAADVFDPARGSLETINNSIITATMVFGVFGLTGYLLMKGFMRLDRDFITKNGLSVYLATKLSLYSSLSKIAMRGSEMLAKISRGFRASLAYLVSDLINGLSSAVNIISGAIDRFRKDPIGSLKRVGNAIVNGIKTVGNALIWAVTHPGETISMISNAIVNGVNAYIDALKKDPIGTLAKTAIVVGGVALIATGVAAPAGAAMLATFGATATIAGASLLIAQDAWEYATAETDEEILARARENKENLIWAAGGLADGALGIYSIGRAAYATRYTSLEYLEQAKLEKAFGKYTAGVTSVPEKGVVEIKISNKLKGNERKAVLWHEVFGEVPKRWTMTNKDGKIIILKDGILIPDNIKAMNEYINKYKGHIKKILKMELKKYARDGDFVGPGGDIFLRKTIKDFDETLAAEVIASYAKGREAFIAFREKNWWAEYPMLVKLVDENIPLWWKIQRPSRSAIGGIVASEIGNEMIKSSRVNRKKEDNNLLKR